LKDPESGKTLVFLTNNTSLPALSIAALYKNRWQDLNSIFMEVAADDLWNAFNAMGSGL
jgi:hypothetical protein